MSKKRLLFCMIAALALVFLSVPCWSSPQMDAAKKWVDNEFQPSTLTKDQQMKEMEWFIKASKPFKGMKIKVVSETIPTHEYEAKVLTKAFEEITGIKVAFDLIQEGDVVEKLQTQWASGKNIYDGLGERFRPHRHPYALRLCGAPERFHGGRRKRRDPADPGC